MACFRSVKYGVSIGLSTMQLMQRKWKKLIIRKSVNLKSQLVPCPMAQKMILPAGSWKWANPKDIKPFSAVAYFFAKKLYEKYHIPIGIINSSVGGTPMEAWTSEEGLKDFPSIISIVEKNKDTAYINSLRRPDGLGGGFPRQQQQSTNDKGTNGPVPWYDLPIFLKAGKPLLFLLFGKTRVLKI